MKAKERLFSARVLTYLYRKVPELLHPWVPHPGSPEHLNHLHWMAMLSYQLFLHSLDSNSSICFAFSLFQLHLKREKEANVLLLHLLEEADTESQPCLLLHHLQQLLLEEGALLLSANNIET